MIKDRPEVVIHLLLYEVQDGEEHLISIVLNVNCKTFSLSEDVRLTTSNRDSYFVRLCLLTSNQVSVQTVEEVLMLNRLREVAPHGCEDFFQLQGDVTTIRPHTGCLPPLFSS